MRRYNQWAGNPKGEKEDVKRCVVEVFDKGRSILTHQCYRKRGYGPNGLLCRQHANRRLICYYIPKDIPMEEKPQ